MGRKSRKGTNNANNDVTRLQANNTQRIGSSVHVKMQLTLKQFYPSTGQNKKKIKSYRSKDVTISLLFLFFF